MSLHTALKHLPQCYWYYYIQNILPLELSSFSMPILLKQYLKFMYLIQFLLWLLLNNFVQFFDLSSAHACRMASVNYVNLTKGQHLICSNFALAKKRVQIPHLSKQTLVRDIASCTWGISLSVVCVNLVTSLFQPTDWWKLLHTVSYATGRSTFCGCPEIYDPWIKHISSPSSCC